MSFRASAVCLAVALAFSPAHAAPGDPDLAFGTGGFVLTGDFAGGGRPVARAVAVQPDGKVIAAGQGGSGFALVRYLSDGGRDPGFGNGGRVVTPFSAGASIYALAIQPDGRIIAAGYADSSRGAVFALARYLPDGALDPDFAGDGIQTTRLGREAGANALALLPDGRIVAAGRAHVGFRDRFALAVYLPDGRLDPSFGSAGRVITRVMVGDASANGIAVQADGALVAAGYLFPSLDSRPRISLIRYLTDGRRDRSFGSRGVVTTLVGEDGGSGSAVAIGPDGRIFVAGYASSLISGVDFAVICYSKDGALDSGFANNGISLVDVEAGSYDIANALVLQPDGKIIVAGQSDDSLRGTRALVRYNATGILDAGFGQGGLVVPDPHGTTDRGYGVALAPDGAIVVAGGTTVGGEDGERAFFVDRYEP